MNPCAGDRTVATAVVDEAWAQINGRPDRHVVVTRDCGHTYNWSAPLTAPLPAVGTRAMRCPGPDLPFVAATWEGDEPAGIIERPKGKRRKQA